MRSFDLLFGSQITLRELGFGEGLARHLLNYDQDSLLTPYCQPPYYWLSSPIRERSIPPLWESGTVLVYFNRATGLFEKCSLEDIGSPRASYKTAQALLADLFLELYEGELTDEELRAVAGELGFQHVERFLSEVLAHSGPLYQAWRKQFPATFEG